MKVYVVASTAIFSKFGGVNVNGVFSTKEKAEAYLDKVCKEQQDFSNAIGSNAGAFGYQLFEQEVDFIN